MPACVPQIPACRPLPRLWDPAQVTPSGASLGSAFNTAPQHPLHPRLISVLPPDKQPLFLCPFSPRWERPGQGRAVSLAPQPLASPPPAPPGTSQHRGNECMVKDEGRNRVGSSGPWLGICALRLTGRVSPSLRCASPPTAIRPGTPPQRGRRGGARLLLEAHRLLAGLSCGPAGPYGGTVPGSSRPRSRGRAPRMPHCPSAGLGAWRGARGAAQDSWPDQPAGPPPAHLQVTGERPSPEGRSEAGAGWPRVLGSRAGRRGSQGREGSDFRGSVRPVASELLSLLCDAGGPQGADPLLPQRVPNGFGVGEGGSS